jgi:hypothetical protein
LYSVVDVTTIGRRGDGDPAWAAGIPRAAHFFGNPSSQPIALETVQEMRNTRREAQKNGSNSSESLRLPDAAPEIGMQGMGRVWLRYG